MNKLERKLKGKAKFKKRLNQIGITNKIIQEWEEKGINYNLNCYKSTGKPCSCPMCSPGKWDNKPKAKYKMKYKNKSDE